MPLVRGNLQMITEEQSRFDFDLLADKYDSWYESAKGRMYDRLEKKAISRYLPLRARGKKLLEVGCGTGHWSRFFSEYGFEVTRVDISKRMINTALQKGVLNVSFHIADGHLLLFADDSFDLTTAITTLEFVRDTEAVLREMIRCTRKAGKILLGVLNGLSKVNRQKANSSKNPYAAARLFSPVELKEFLQPYGRVEITVGCFVPVQSWLIPFASRFDHIARMFASQKGAFIGAVLKL